ncbi:hypothetical protein [Gracilimonas sp.]|uniref:hypothetical protein n=1 Tax=Gracilimonas sp. TaxID=1974203 RepID=UPI002870F99D|nr:hypothetical protein [Gracilimonas sp.]
MSGQNNLFVFVRHPDAEIKLEGNELHYSFHRKKRNHSYDENELNFEFNLQIKIPREMTSELSTINGKEVSITGMFNGASAGNINGNVFVSEVRGPVKAKTINGDVKVEYAEAPSGEADFGTINGSIEVIAPKNLSALVTFKSLRGELYTDFEQIKHVSNRKKRNTDGMKRFSIDVSDAIQFGEGGPELRFELLNGNAYIKKIKS